MLQESSHKGIDLDIGILKNGYDKFAIFVFSESKVFTDMAAYRNVLVYTRVELSGLTEVSKKKCGDLSPESP